MKKFLIVLLSLLLAFTCFFGCNNTETPPLTPGGDDNGNNEEPEPPKIDYAALSLENKTRALEYVKLIKDNYWNETTELSSLIPGQGAPYLWPYTEQASMANSAIALIDKEKETEKYNEMKTYLVGLLEGLRFYRVKIQDGFTNTEFGVCNSDYSSYAIYNSGRNTSKKDNASTDKNGIFFDDNIWVAKEFYYAYKNLGDVKYLNEAINIVNWIIGDGMETEKCATTGKAMYGIYWKWGAKDLFTGETDDNKNASLNTCSSAPTAMMLVKIANELKDEKFANLKTNYMLNAKRIFNFVYTTLRDEATNTFKDKIFIFKNTAGKKYLGTVDEQILPYNTGCMMTAAAELYKDAVSKNETANANSYLTRAKEIAAGADSKFGNTQVVQGQYSYNKNSWFTSFLIEGFIDISPYDTNCEKYIDHMRSSLDYGWKNNKNAEGFVCPAWVAGWKEFSNTGVSEENPLQILLQSANAHSYSMLASYYSTIKN